MLKNNLFSLFFVVATIFDIYSFFNITLLFTSFFKLTSTLYKMAKYPQEITKYPQEQTILYKEEKHKFNYTILQEGVYPSEPNLKYTLSHRYKIPDNYEIKTIWGKNENQKTVKCSIIYINNNPFFRVYYGWNFESKVESNKSASDAATLLHKVSQNTTMLFL